MIGTEQRTEAGQYKPELGQIQERILYLPKKGIGEAVIATSAIKRVKKYFPDAHISVGSWNKQQEEIFQALDLETIQLPAILSWRKKARDPREWKNFALALVEFNSALHCFDRVISPDVPHIYHQAVQLLSLIEPAEKERFLVFDQRKRPIEQLRYMGFLVQDTVDQLLGVNQKTDYFEPEIRLREIDQVRSEILWEETGFDRQRTVVCSLRTNESAKNLPYGVVRNLTELLVGQQRNIAFVNFTDADESKLHRDCSEGRVAFVKDKSIMAVAAFIHQAEAYIGGDTSLTHLANALKVPTLAFFGPTDPLVWSPLHRGNVHVSFVEMDCRGTACRTKYRCHRERQYCMEAIGEKELETKLAELLN